MKYLLAVFFITISCIAKAEIYQCQDMRYEMKGDVAKAIYPERDIGGKKISMFCTYINGVRLDPDKDTRSKQGPIYLYSGIYDSCSMNAVLIFDTARGRVAIMDANTLESKVLNCVKTYR